MSFYQLDVFNEQAVNWHIAGLLVENKLGARVLYEGNLSNNTAYLAAIYNLLERVDQYVWGGPVFPDTSLMNLNEN